MRAVSLLVRDASPLLGVIRSRRAGRRRPAHADGELADGAAFDRLRGLPEIEVDTSDGYRPGLAEVVAFVNRG